MAQKHNQWHQMCRLIKKMKGEKRAGVFNEKLWDGKASKHKKNATAFGIDSVNTSLYAVREIDVLYIQKCGIFTDVK